MARQDHIEAIVHNGKELEEAFRADLIVERKLLFELKSAERISPVHGQQVLTCLRLLNMPPGFLVNFGAATFKDGVKRIANGYQGLFRCFFFVSLCEMN